MGEGRLERLLPLAGVLFGIIIAIGFVATGETPETDDNVEKIFDYYDDGGKVLVGILLLAIGAILFMLFASALRTHMRSTGKEWLATLSFAGAVIFVVGLAGFATSQFSLAQAADDKNMEALQSLNYIDNSNFPPAVIGIALLYIGVGWHTLSSRALPAWLGWVSLIVGLLAMAGPVGFLAFLLVMPWSVLMGILLYRRQSTAAPTAA